MNAHTDPVLIVDDEPDMCWTLEHILQKGGMPCHKALDGASALGLVSQHHFTVAIVDIKLPDIEGLELARRIRRVDPAIHIIIISGYYHVGEEIIQHAIDTDLINDFIGKPFENDRVLETARQVYAQ